jgi:hypothetical protein
VSHLASAWTTLAGVAKLRHNERMTTLLSEAELLRSFRDIDRDEVELTPDLVFPLALEDVVAWTYGPRAFLVFRDRPDGPARGMVFHRNPGAMPDVVAMCEWCHSVRGHGRVKLMSVSRDKHRQVGLYLCSDLGCVTRSSELPGPDDLHRRASTDVLRRISVFASQRVF